MEMLFDAYLRPGMLHDRNLAITNNPKKIAEFLSSTENGERGVRIFSYCDDNLEDYWRWPATCVRTPDLRLFLDY